MHKNRALEIGHWPLAIGHWSLVIVLLLVGCSTGETGSPADVFPGEDTVPDWMPAGDVETFDRENLYDLVDGQAESFFAYGFEQVAVRSYENTGGTVLGVEIWQLATAADAYGLFTTSIAGSPVDIGNDGDGDPGRRLAFWQDRYYVQVRARQEIDDADLRSFGEEVSAALPGGGQRPALVDRLPSDGLAERSVVFFHEEISIQNQLWLGGENLLGLGPDTDGVLAQYDFGGAIVRLLLVQYPDADGASAGMAALEGRQIDGLVTADVRDTLLGTVFGEVDQATAATLLADALEGK